MTTETKPLGRIQPMFCPRCHRQVEPPSFLKTGKVKVTGSINLGCAYCKKGKVRFKPPPTFDEEPVEV